MRPRWSNTFAIATLEEDWEQKPMKTTGTLVLKQFMACRSFVQKITCQWVNRVNSSSLISRIRIC